MYLPVQIGRNGKQEAIGEPFYIKSNGDIVSFPNNSFSTCSLSFDRKYPIYYKIKKIIPRIGEGIVEISDNASFTGATIICSIPGQHPAISGIVHFDNTVNSRYWRVKATNDTLDIAEIIFKDSLGHILDVSPLNCGKNIVDVKYSGDNFKNGSDNDALTFFSIAGDDIWLGFDLGMNANVKEIMYYKRSDGNDIFPGYNYSLYEWRKNIWVKIKSANSNNGTTLFLEDIPQNTILKLVCDDIGTENRPFAIIDGRVRWF